MHQLFAVLVWMAFAAACMSASVYGQVVMLIWWPNGVAIATLYLMPRREWWLFLSLAMIGSCLINMYFGSLAWLAFMQATANFGEAVIVAWLAQNIVQSRQGDFLSVTEIFGVICAAVAGAVFSAIVAVGIANPAADWLTFFWWMVTVMLGTLVTTPLFLALAAGIGLGPPSVMGSAHGRGQELVFATIAAFALSLWVLHQPNISFLFVPMSATIFMVTRYGHFGAVWAVLAFGLAGTVTSFGGDSPAAFIDLPQRGGGLVLQSYMATVLATSVPLAALLVSQTQLASKLREQNRNMQQNLALFSMMETIAGIGRWSNDPRTNLQHWSDELFEINGLEQGNPVEGEEMLKLLPDGGEQLLAQMEANRFNTEPYSVEFSIERPDGEMRDLHMRLTNEFDPDGELVQQFGAVMDVTDQKRREKALDDARNRAMRLAAEAQILANTDALTGLANRRSLLGQLKKCIQRSEDSGRPLALIGFDIDHFKQINDRYGHQTGDHVLVRVSEIAGKQVRASDLLGRTGGEEFVWLMPGADAELARNAAERLRQAIEEQSGADSLPKVTVSVGVAQWEPGISSSTLLAKADTALYDSKNAGRNRVSLAA